jgi:hypothetical protein
VKLHSGIAPRLRRLALAIESGKTAQEPVSGFRLHFAHYNFCRIHKTLRVTPAMESKIADHVWDLAELLG